MGEVRIVSPGKTRGYPFLTYETDFVLFLAVKENSVLPID